ncbi:MAG TPA: hypothetical protein VE777_09095 [Gaiellales bacterium]|nr:hypothetical protein [Gaiellales bacterium]
MADPLHRRHTDVMDHLDAHLGLALLWALPPALASAVAAIHAERDARQFEEAIAAFLDESPDAATSAS